MTLTAAPLQRAYSQLLDVARGDAYGSTPQLYAFTWLAAARMVIAGATEIESLASLAETATWKQLADAGFPSEAIERVGAFRSQDIARRAHAVGIVVDLHRAMGDTHWDILPLTVDSAGRRSYEVDLAVLPPLASYLLDLVGKAAANKELWIPFDGMGQLAIEAFRRGWTVRTASPLGMSQLPLELLIIIETGHVEHPRIVRDVHRTASGAPSNKASHVLALAPFGMSTRGSRLADWDTTGAFKQFAKSESWAVYEFLNRATERAVFVVPQGVLFSGGQEERLREYLLHRGGEYNEVEAVIGLPTGFLAAAPSLGGAVLIVTPGQGHEAIQVTDLASGRRSVSDAAEILRQEHEHVLSGSRSTARTGTVSRDEVAANGYSLAPSRYLRRVSDLGESRRLGELCEPIRPPSPAREETGIAAYEVGVGDLNTWRPLDSHGDKVVHLRGEPKPGTLLRPGDLVLSIKGTVGKAAIVGSMADGERLVPSQSCLGLRLLQDTAADFSPEYLLMYLRSPHGQAQLEGLQVGTGVQHVSPNTLLAASIPLPTHDEYVRVREDFAELCQLEEQRARLEGQMRDIRRRRWTLEDSQ